MNELAVLGGIWMSLLYSATVVPASVWVIQLTVSRGWLCGLACSLGLTLGQLPWAITAAAVLFQFPGLWQTLDLGLRALAAGFFIWMALRSARAPAVRGLHVETDAGTWALIKSSFWRSLVMPWRLPLWAGLIISISVHLTGPGWGLAPQFGLGALAGQMGWFAHFVLIAGLFGRRVPEDISLRSINKLRLLATVVLAGLALIILAPVAFPPAP
ncbi:MAG: hypothetical protein AB3N33_13105 [Puniceicoccaceae bacterium]